LFEVEIEGDLRIMCEILNEWKVEYNLYFAEKQVLIKGMSEWCVQITEEIKKQAEMVLDSNEQL
jgi:hypothetical protein